MTIILILIMAKLPHDPHYLSAAFDTIDHSMLTKIYNNVGL